MRDRRRGFRRGTRTTPARAGSLEIAAVRLGRLGDLVMVEPALRWLSATPHVRLKLVTDPHYVDAFARALPEVEITTEVGSPDLVLDLHRVAASRRLRRGHPWLGVGKEDVRRRLRVLAPQLPVMPRFSWPERHMDAAERGMRQLGIVPGPRPTPVPRFGPFGAREPGLLGLVPGAGHATKQWPVERFAALAEAWSGPLVVFGSEEERSLAAAVGADVWPAPSLTGLFEGLSRCAAVVAGDTGPLHVAGALGAVPIGLFGPTPTDTGFWVWDETGVALRTGSGCSPCSLHGSAVCPKRHHRCLADLSVEAVLEAVRAAVPEQPEDRCA